MIKKFVLLILGSIFLAFGFIGIFLPILPTTPFVILAATCFAISSPKMNDRLSKSKLFGEFIQNYRKKTGITKKTKRKALISLWISMLISAIIVQKVFVCIILIFIGSCVTLHILSLTKAIEDV